jgi:hypothetical protein
MSNLWSDKDIADLKIWAKHVGTRYKVDPDDLISIVYIKLHHLPPSKALTKHVLVTSAIDILRREKIRKHEQLYENLTYFETMHPEVQIMLERAKRYPAIQKFLETGFIGSGNETKKFYAQLERLKSETKKSA